MMISCNLAYRLVIFVLFVSFDDSLGSFFSNLIALNISEILFNLLVLDFVVLFGHFDFFGSM